jgi:hypothetical protein
VCLQRQSENATSRSGLLTKNITNTDQYQSSSRRASPEQTDYASPSHLGTWLSQAYLPHSQSIPDVLYTPVLTEAMTAALA